MFKKRFAVDIIESERGWGRKLDSVETFATLEEAEKFQEEFNSQNTCDHVPDWYMVASNPYIRSE